MARVCPGLLSFFLDNRLREWLFRPDRILEAWIREGMTAADIGCGPGFFTVPMARLVGSSGRVYAVDLQQGMLDKVQRKARSAGLQNRITLHRCPEEYIGLDTPLDFALCFWMMHEVPSAEHLLTELRSLLKLGGSLLIAEPIVHVRRKSFDATVASAMKIGFAVSGKPKIRGSYSALLSISDNLKPGT